MRFYILLAVVMVAMMVSLVGCATAPTTADPIVTIGEQLSLRAAQGILNKDFAAGKMTRPQYEAASNMLLVASQKLLASNGVLTQDDAKALVAQAVKSAFDLYVPELPPIGPATQP